MSAKHRLEMSCVRATKIVVTLVFLCGFILPTLFALQARSTLPAGNFTAGNVLEIRIQQSTEMNIEGRKSDTVGQVIFPHQIKHTESLKQSRPSEQIGLHLEDSGKMRVQNRSWARQRGTITQRKRSLDSDYQSDFTGYENAKKAFVYSPTGPDVQTGEKWQSMRPTVECAGTAMTLTAQGRGYTNLLVDREGSPPLSLLHLPPHCGYNMKYTWKDLTLKVPYDGCYIVQENGQYVLPLLWRGRPVKISCPVASIPDILCSPAGMVLKITKATDGEQTLKAKVGHQQETLVSATCAHHMESSPEESLYFTPYTASCVTLKDGQSIITVVVGATEFTMACPVPMAALHSSPPSSSTNNPNVQQETQPPPSKVTSPPSPQLPQLHSLPSDPALASMPSHPMWFHFLPHPGSQSSSDPAPSKTDPEKTPSPPSALPLPQGYSHGVGVPFPYHHMGIKVPYHPPTSPPHHQKPAPVPVSEPGSQSKVPVPESGSQSQVPLGFPTGHHGFMMPLLYPYMGEQKPVHPDAEQTVGTPPVAPSPPQKPGPAPSAQSESKLPPGLPMGPHGLLMPYMLPVDSQQTSSQQPYVGPVPYPNYLLNFPYGPYWDQKNVPTAPPPTTTTTTTSPTPATTPPKILGPPGLRPPNQQLPHDWYYYLHPDLVQPPAAPPVVTDTSPIPGPHQPPKQPPFDPSKHPYMHPHLPFHQQPQQPAPPPSPPPTEPTKVQEPVLPGNPFLHWLQFHQQPVQKPVAPPPPTDPPKVQEPVMPPGKPAQPPSKTDGQLPQSPFIVYWPGVPPTTPPPEPRLTTPTAATITTDPLAKQPGGAPVLSPGGHQQPPMLYYPPFHAPFPVPVCPPNSALTCTGYPYTQHTTGAPQIATTAAADGGQSLIWGPPEMVSPIDGGKPQLPHPSIAPSTRPATPWFEPPKGSDPEVLLPTPGAPVPAKVSPALSCEADFMVVLLPNADKDSVQVKELRSSWVPVSSAPLSCQYELRTVPSGVVLSTPLPACHSRQPAEPYVLSLPLKFWDLALGRYRFMDLRCPFIDVLPTKAPPAPTAKPMPPPTMAPPVTTTTASGQWTIFPPVPPPGQVTIFPPIPPTSPGGQVTIFPPVPTTAGGQKTVFPPIPTGGGQVTLPFPSIPTTAGQVTLFPPIPTTGGQVTVFPPIPTATPLPRPEVLCSTEHMTVALPPGPLSALVVRDLEGNEVKVENAPVHCGYKVRVGKSGHITVILPYNTCHVKIKDNHYTVELKYQLFDDRRGRATLSCPHATPPPTPGPNCDVPSDTQVACSSAPVSPSECHYLGCCYCHATRACYYPMDECTADGHFVFTVPSTIMSPPLNPAMLVAGGNASCPPLSSTSNYALFKIPLDGCGAHKFEVGQTVIYMVEILNTIQTISLNYGTITRESPVRVLVECRFLPGSVVSVGYLVKKPSLGPSIHAQGVFGVQLRIAKDPVYSSYHPQYHLPLHLLLGRPLYLEVRLLNPPDPTVVLLVHYCVAYPRSVQAAWVLIYDGCPNPLDPAPTVTPTPPRPNVPHQVRRFTVSAFQFLTDGGRSIKGGSPDSPDSTPSDEEIYFMCSTEICSPSDGPCVEGCFGGDSSKGPSQGQQRLDWTDSF